MNNIQKEYAKIFKNVKKNAKVCIYGSNNVAENIYDNLKELRSDVEVKFFADTFNSGEMKNLPIYLTENLDEHLKEIDTVIIASYSGRYYIKLILNMFDFNNIVMISEKILELNNTKKEIKYNVEESAKIFKTFKDRQMYRFLAKARNNRLKYTYKIKQWYDKNHPKRVLCYALDHYYEYLNRDAIEVAIDGGACNAIHSLINLQLLKNCKKVYAFEPCYEKFKQDILDKLIKKKNEIEIVQKALWSENNQLQFREELSPSYFSTSSVLGIIPESSRATQVITVDATTLDSFVEQNNLQRVDFIKLDLENAEQQALIGAEKTILKFRPQMAISIYHSDEQFYGIPVYLRNLLKNYVYRLGHYRQNASETVLYAIPKELL